MAAAQSALCTLGVFAHPDDEVFGWGGTIALMADRGVRVVLAVATGGEGGEIVNPELQGKVDAADLPRVRQEEQACAQRVLGVAEIIRLGYRDSGMAGTDRNRDPDAFINQDPDEVTGRIVSLMRRVRPEVVFTFDERGGYGHPDHIFVQGAARRAFELAGDPSAYPEAGSPWTPLKLYYPTLAQRMMRAVLAGYKAAGVPFSFGAGLDNDDLSETVPGSPDELITTITDTSSTIDRKLAAFRCYATQHRPEFFYFTAPEAVLRGPLSHEYAVLTESRVPTHLPEHDPFAGISSAL